MNTYPSKSINQRRGSIYLVVLVVVAAVTTMVLVGTSLRRTSAEQYRAMDDRTRVRHAARSATETALTYMSDKETFLMSARAGKSYSKTVGKSTITISAIDKDTRGPATDSTSTLLVTASAVTDEARSQISFEVPLVSSYISLLLEKGATSYWELGEAGRSSVAVDQIGSINGIYNWPNSAGGESFPDGGKAPTIFKTRDSIQIPHNSSFEAEQGTIVFWAQTNVPASAGQQGLIAKEDDANRELSQAIFLEGGELVYRAEGNRDSNDLELRTDASMFKDKDWHHVAYSFGFRGTKVYIDGVRVIHRSGSWLGLHYNIINAKATNTRPWTIGARGQGTGGAASNPLDGSIARFAFFPTQLSDEEITELMAAQFGASKLESTEGSFTRVIE